MNALQISHSHSKSFVLGAAAACAVMLALGASRGTTGPLQRVVSDPYPASIVRIVEGTPYTVPQNTALVLKSFGTSSADGAIAGQFVLSINGTAVVGGTTRGPNGGVTGDLGFPIVANAGDVISIAEPFPGPDSVMALGYLDRP